MQDLGQLITEEDARSEEGPEGWKDVAAKQGIATEGNCNGLPNSKWGSDHIPIMATFKFC